MRDSLGGTVSLVIIMVFIVIALGYMAFNVNYTKAFRMKDKIISLYEDYQGNCGGDCQDAISDYSRTLGYDSSGLVCSNVGDGYQQGKNGLYCYKETCSSTITSSTDGSNSFIDGNGVILDRKNKCYYRVVTRINLQIPIIENVFDFRFFYIFGDTKPFEKE
jgi:hypothetical protein